MKAYPNTVSRTLTPESKSLVTVIGRHDKRLTDAELNLIQDIQDYKRSRVLENTTFSGCLTYSPFIFDSTKSLFLEVPAFDILFAGEVVKIGGNRNSNLALNKVTIPQPIQWDGGSTADDARVLVVYLEMWFKALDPEFGTGYGQIAGDNYFYPLGCVDGDFANYIHDDTVDPFQGQATSAREQIQWAIRTASLPLSYDFDKYAFGLDPAINPDTGAIYGRGSIATNQNPSIFTFANMGPINGDSGLWRAGDGNTLNPLQTMDGYTYAMPLAVVFQRNTGFYSVDQNPFGSASISQSGSGLLSSGFSGRLDGKFADVVYQADLVDTRLTVSLTGYDYDKLMQQAFTDLVSGETNIRIARGESPGAKTTMLGSELEYAVTFGQSPVNNTDRAGSFDGYRNGFSSDARSFKVTEIRTVQQKSVGTQGQRWNQNDAFVVQLNADVNPSAVISSVVVQSLLTKVDGSNTPINLFGGQVSITGLGTRAVIVTIAQNLAGTQFDPGTNPIIVTFSVAYPSGLGDDLRKIMKNIEGGSLFDTSRNKTLNTFGVSDYLISANQNKQNVNALYSYNPSYSNLVFGTRVEIKLPASSATVQVIGSITNNLFSISRNNIDSRYRGLYIISARDADTGLSYTIADQTRRVDSNNMYVTIPGTISSSANLIFTVLLTDTCQVSFNSAVKAISSIEETGIIGIGTAESDQRVSFGQIKRFGDRNEIILYTNKAEIKGIAGDDTDRLIFVFDSSSNSYIAYKISSVSFNLGIVKITVPPIVNLEGGQKFFIPVSLIVSLDKNSSMVLVGSYRPYQGEGQANREYALVNAEGAAWITSNGTGSAPVIGIKDTFPYDRQLPISTTLPALASWSDSDLKNQSLTGDLSDNYEAKRAQNIEHTAKVNLYTNDFIEPIAGWKRKKIKLVSSSGSRGFNKTIPHVGFAIKAPKTKSILGEGLQSTVAPVTLYVNNVVGLDSNDGLAKTQPKKTISSAIKALPPVIKHPVSILLMDSGTNYSLKDFQVTDFQIALIGEGETRSQRYYSLANLSFTMQESARLTISKETTAASRVIIDGDQASFGDGVTSAFNVNDSRVIFNGLQIQNFRQPAVVSTDSDVEFLDCSFIGNQQAVAATQGSSIIINKGILNVGELATGVVLVDSDLIVSGDVSLVAASPKVDSFFVADRTSNITLEKHDVQAISFLETNVTSSVVVVKAQMNSTVSCASTWVSGGKAILATNSVLTRSILKNPFIGNIDTDASSTVVTS